MSTPDTSPYTNEVVVPVAVTPDQIKNAPQIIEDSLNTAWTEAHKTLSSILKKQEQSYLKAVTGFLRIKEKELKAVTEELTLKATKDDYKDSLITRLQNCIEKLETEGGAILTNVIH